MWKSLSLLQVTEINGWMSQTELSSAQSKHHRARAEMCSFGEFKTYRMSRRDRDDLQQ